MNPAAASRPARSLFARGIAVLVLCLGSVGSGQETNQPARELTKLWFPVGEELTYKVYWGLIPIGKARIVARWVEQEGRPLLAIRYRARSGKVLASLYPVDDIVEALIDPASFLPVRYTEKMKEGKQEKHEVTGFDFTNRVARWESKLKKKHLEYPIAADTRDLVTFMYFMRSQRFQPDEQKHFQVMADEKIYDLFVKVHGRETLNLPGFGSVPVLRTEPEAAFQGLFVRKGKMTLWVTDDERFVIAKVAARVPVASIKVVLSEVRGPGEDFWVRKTRENAKTDESRAEDSEVERALGELDAPTSGAVLPSAGQSL